jgi:PncC family amidohydrolase
MIEAVEAQQVLELCTRHGSTLAVAETDSGGLLLAALTATPGSSAVVLGGVVPYHDRLKRTLLGIEGGLLEQYGAVSAEVAAAMAAAVRRLAGASVGLATTGIAGPGGATATKPVGLAYVAAAGASSVLVREHHWSGDRAHNRQASARAALELALELLEKG